MLWTIFTSPWRSSCISAGLKLRFLFFMLVQMTEEAFISSRSRMNCRYVSWPKSWRDYVCPANNQVTCIHPVPSPLCWMYTWTTTPPPLRAPAHWAPHPFTATPSQNPHATPSIVAKPITPQTEERTGRRGMTMSPCCQCLTEEIWLLNEGGRLWEMAVGE